MFIAFYPKSLFILDAKFRLWLKHHKRSKKQQWNKSTRTYDKRKYKCNGYRRKLYKYKNSEDAAIQKKIEQITKS